MKNIRSKTVYFWLICLLTCFVTPAVHAQVRKTTLKAPLPVVRMSAVAATAGGKLFFIGGLDSTGCSSDTYEFDPAQNRWTKKAAMPTARASAGAVELDGSIYVLGGRKDNDVLAVVEKYDPSSDAWTKCSSMPTARWYLMVAAVDGRIYAIGGIAGVGEQRQVLDIVERYEPLTDTWTTLTAMPVGNSNAGAAVLDSKIYIIGGRLKAGPASGGATDKVYIYDVKNNVWSKGPSLNQARTGSEACTLDGKIYSIGGASRGSNTSSVEIVSPGEEEWKLVDILQGPRTDHSCAVLGGKIYILGGVSTPSMDGILATVEELSP